MELVAAVANDALHVDEILMRLALHVSADEFQS
jgi:hypothetical protein